jgi:glutathione synthase/RimK-type ligase-like ATP-grasp enzyme
MGPGRTLFRHAAGAAVRGRLIAAAGPAAARRHAALRDRHAGGARKQAAARLYREIWADAAQALGAELAELGGDRREARGSDGRIVPILGNNTLIDSQANFDRLLDKAWTQKKLTASGLRVPAHLQTSSPRAAVAFLRDHGPLVVKPAGGTGAGWGITCGVRSRGDLLLAGLDAARYHPDLLLEQQAPGDMYRVLVLDGEVIDVVRRDRPAVTGDGRSTIAELIEAENRRRLEAEGELGLLLLRTDLDCLIHLRGRGLRLRSVPAAGERVTVKTSSSESSPEDSETVRDLHPALAQASVAAAAAVGLRLAGVDLVATAEDGVIIEVNARPGLRYHYQVRDRANSTPVARLILRRLLET